jgi:hypothetical protein
VTASPACRENRIALVFSVEKAGVKNEAREGESRAGIGGAGFSD